MMKRAIRRYYHEFALLFRGTIAFASERKQMLGNLTVAGGYNLGPASSLACGDLASRTPAVVAPLAFWRRRFCSGIHHRCSAILTSNLLRLQRRLLLTNTETPTFPLISNKGPVKPQCLAIRHTRRSAQLPLIMSPRRLLATYESSMSILAYSTPILLQVRDCEKG
jgi:hypothetical protein